MNRDTIVYFGIIQYEYNNAMCQHAKGIKQLINAIGYRAITIGMSPKVNRTEYDIIDEETYVIREGYSFSDRVKECITSSVIEQILFDIGLYRIKTMIMADYRFLPMWKLMRYCQRNGINYAVDIMDQFMAERSLFSKIKKIDCDLRIKIFYPRIKRRMYICSSYNDLIGRGKNTAVIPGVTWDRCLNDKKNSDQIVLSFLGRPGIRCEKEKIDWVIRAISECGFWERFILNLAGFDGKVFFRENQALREYIFPNVRFLGRLRQEECNKLLDESDFGLVIRPDNTLSKYGLSTKIGEAFSRCIPVFATDTSDNKTYIKDGKSGFICKCSYEDVKGTLMRISRLSREDIQRMREYIYNHNPLNYSNYIDDFRRVSVEDVSLPR